MQRENSDSENSILVHNTNDQLQNITKYGHSDII